MEFMRRQMTAGGRLSIALCIAWALSCSVVMFSNGSSNWITEFAGLAVFVLSCPLGLLSGALTSMHGSASREEIVGYLALTGANCFFLGYGLTGIWRFLRNWSERPAF